MTCQKILVATDFSPASEAALVYASALACQWNAKLLIVHVEGPPNVMTNEFLLMTQNFYPNPEVRRRLEAVVPTDKAVKYEHRLVQGEAGEEILRLAEQEFAGLIVIGTHGRIGVSRLLMGSVAEAVVRKAKCPVLTLKATSEQVTSADLTTESTPVGSHV
jgi:nucleotide-binding universal stress UspA family protein